MSSHRSLICSLLLATTVPLMLHAQGRPDGETAAQEPATAPASESAASTPSETGADRFHNFTLQASPERADQVFSMTSDPVPAKGTTAEIIHRAQLCAAQHVRQKKGDTLVQLSQPDAGLLVVNLQSEFRSALIAYVAVAKLTIEARDGRFRFTASDLDTPIEGYRRIPGIYKVWGTGWQAALASIKAVTDTVANCMATASNDNW